MNLRAFCRYCRQTVDIKVKEQRQAGWLKTISYACSLCHKEIVWGQERDE